MEESEVPWTKVRLPGDRPDSAAAAAAAVTVVSGGGRYGVHELQPSKHGADIVSQGASFYENSCVVQEESETKSSVKMPPGVMSQSTSLNSWQQSEVSLEGERREMMVRASSGANTGMVGPAESPRYIITMRSGAGSVQHLLSPAALGVLKHAVTEARRRGHPQVQPLHVVSMLLTHAGSRLRQACMLSHPQNAQTAECRALEVCFNVALDHLPQSAMAAASQPILSNALMGALKRAHAHQRRGCPEHQHSPLLAVKVEIDQLIISILDDPSVSRVMKEAGFSCTNVKFNLEDGPASAAAAAAGVVTFLSGGGHGVYEPQPSKRGADIVSQGASFFENSCVVQEENETKSSVKMPPGVMSQSTSLNSWQQSEESLEGERREMMVRASSGANTGMVGPAVSLPSREEDVRNMVEILLSPSNRNALLIGDTAVGANAVVEDFVYRLKTGLVPKQLTGLQFLDPKLSLSSFSHCSSLQMEQNLAELSKIVGECMPAGAILHIGDLQWLAEPMQLKKSPSNFCPAQRTAAELGNLLARHANNRLWFVGVVTPHTFARLQVLHPSLASEWKLQSMQVITTAFQTPQTTFPQRFSSYLQQPVIDRQTPKVSLPVPGSSRMVASVPMMQSSRYTGTTQVTQMYQCCADCLSKFEEERRQLSFSPQLTPQLSPIQKWLSSSDEVTSGGPNQTKDNPPAVQQAAQLSQKWQQFCRMHHGEASDPVPTRSQQQQQQQQQLPSPLTRLPASSHSQSCGSSVASAPEVLHHDRARKPRYTIKTRTNRRVLDDGYKWRKYGQRPSENSPHPRNYYGCTTANCPVRKRTERSTEDPGLLLTVYSGTHTHPVISSYSSNHSPQATGGTGLMYEDLDMRQDKEGFTTPQVNMHLLSKEEPELSKVEGQGIMLENPISFKDNNNNISNDDIMGDDEFLSLVKRRMKAMAFIQSIDIQETFSEAHSFDQSTIVLGLFNATSNNLEFYFESGENMAKLVGVGLRYAKVIVKHGIIFGVQEIEMEKWEKLWHEVKEGSTKECKIMKVRLPQMSGMIETGGFGEGRDVATSSASINHIFQDDTSMASNYALQVPYLWEISKFFIMERVIDAFHTKCNNILWNESIEAQWMNSCPKDGNEADMTWYQTLKVLFSRGTSSQNDNNKRQEEMNQDEGNGSGDGNGGDGDSPRGFSKIGHVQAKETVTQVNVILLSGGGFFEKNMEPLSISHRHPLSIERLENVKVTPELTFGFFKSRDNKKIQITSSVVFALDLDCDSVESCGHFGWFHDELYESLGPIDQHIQRTAYLKHDFKEGDYVVGKTISKASTSKGITKGNESGYDTSFVVGSSQVARLGLGAGMRHQASCIDNESNEQSIESNCNLTEGGFKILAKHMIHLALLQYKYLAPYIDIIAEQVQDRKYRYDLINHPMCNLQKTQLSGTWIPTGSDEVATYAFKANRKLHEIRVIKEERFLTSGSSGLKTLFKKRNRDQLDVQICSSLEPLLTQSYEKQLYVNHAMSHLVDGQTYTLIESSEPQNPSGNVDAALIRFPILVDYQ